MIKCLVCSLFFVHCCLALTAQDTLTYQFDFGFGKDEPGYTQVLPNTVYSDQRGYGFDFNSSVTTNNYQGNDALKDDYITSDKPFYFSVALPEGNYQVKVLLGDKWGATTTTIKAECRRLMVEKATTKNGQYKEVSFTVHVRDSIIHANSIDTVRLKAREHNYLHWDNKLTLEFSNTAPKICAIEIAPAKEITTIFLAGNSTVVDQAEEPWAAWGQMIPAFFNSNKIVIANYAESGETLKAFEREKRLKKIWSLAKPGDYLFIEFAHNDQKPGGNHLDPFTTYKEKLKEWIAAAKSKQLIPVLVTSMHRRNFDSTGHIINTLDNYPEAMRQVAKEENIPLIDLNAMSKTLYEAWGPERSIKAFVHYPANTFPNQPNELKDNTHFTPYGAYELAKSVAVGMKKAKLGIAKYLKKEVTSFNPAKPDLVEKWNLPQSSFIGLVKPDGN